MEGKAEKANGLGFAQLLPFSLATQQNSSKAASAVKNVEEEGKRESSRRTSERLAEPTYGNHPFELETRANV